MLLGVAVELSLWCHFDRGQTDATACHHMFYMLSKLVLLLYLINLLEIHVC